MSLGLREKVATFCRQHHLLHANETIVVAVSGGPDSLCLLHLLKHLVPDFNLNLIVAHLNHQLRAEAQAEADFVRDIASTWELVCFIERRDVAQAAADRGESLEAAARRLRYQFLGRVADRVAATKIAVGHHADDQAETVLMHLLRGSGLAGLRGMLPSTRLETLDPDCSLTPATAITTRLVRPLLNSSRAEIEAYCQAHQLSPRHDSSNQDTTFFRNRLRQELLPHLETYNPNIRQVLQNSTQIIAADYDFLSDQIEQAYTAIKRDSGENDLTFDLAAWRSLPLALQRGTLRRAVKERRHTLRDLSFEHIEQAVTLLNEGQTGQQVTLPHRLRLILSYDTFTLSDQQSLPQPATDVPFLNTTDELWLRVPGVTQLPHSQWQLTIERVAPEAIEWPALNQPQPWELYLAADIWDKTLRLRSRRPGDLFHPFGLTGQKKVSDFMIDEKIPAHRRDQIPLLIGGGQILWVCGYRAAEITRLQPSASPILHLYFELSSA